MGLLLMILIFFYLVGQEFIKICLIRGNLWNVIYKVIWKGISTWIEQSLLILHIYLDQIMQREYLMLDRSMHWNCFRISLVSMDWRNFEIGGLLYNKDELLKMKEIVNFDENFGKIQPKYFFRMISRIELLIRLTSNPKLI